MSIKNFKTEGENLRTRAVLLCREKKFQEFCAFYVGGTIAVNEKDATGVLYCACRIQSRGELATNIAAQSLFKELDRKYLQWLNPIDELYADNLSRY